MYIDTRGSQLGTVFLDQSPAFFAYFKCVDMQMRILAFGFDGYGTRAEADIPEYS